MTELSFKEIDSEIKSTYYNSDTNVVKEFLNPVLKRTEVYKRETYSFSSSIFSLISESLIEIIKNKCRIYYIVGIEINKEDLEAIERGLQDENGLIESEILKEFGRVEELIDRLDEYSQNIYRYRLQVLSYLISKKILQIKIGFVAKNGRIRNPEKFKFHPKVMIFTDFEGNTIVTNGSINESLGALSHNEESFDVFKSWDKGTIEHFNKHVSKFDDYWGNKSDNIKTIEITDIIEEHVLTKYKSHFRSQDEIFEMEKKLNRIVERNKIIQEEINVEIEPPFKVLDLRGYQKEATDEWFKNGNKGILEMATGTGKTETAIGIIDALVKENKSMFVIVAVHGQSLLFQWVKRLEYYGFKSMGASSQKQFSNWRDELRKKSLGISLGYTDHEIVVTTYQTFSSKDFVDIIKSIEADILLICDEVHHVGAPEFSKGLIENYAYRLGLSATPDRWFDDEGTYLIRKYFDKTVYKFSMKKAIRTINPDTGKTFLCSYSYDPILTNLNVEESEKYLNLTRQIQRRFFVLKKFNLSDPILRGLSFKRAALVQNAKNKLEEFEKLCLKIKAELEYCIIYCSERQLPGVKNILTKLGKVYSEFTQYQDSETREKLLREFTLGRNKGGFDILLAIDCLNEGIDIPSAKIGIFLQHSSNPIEFIQRRGRLLRQHQGKKEAKLYDFIVLPNFLTDSEIKFQELEQRMIQKEFNRFIEFAYLASNTQDAFKKLENVIKMYNLIISTQDKDEL